MSFVGDPLAGRPAGRTSGTLALVEPVLGVRQVGDGGPANQEGARIPKHRSVSGPAPSRERERRHFA